MPVQAVVNFSCAAAARVRKLVDNYRRYAKLEKEYPRLVTETSLSSCFRTVLFVPDPLADCASSEPGPQ